MRTQKHLKPCHDIARLSPRPIQPGHTCLHARCALAHAHARSLRTRARARVYARIRTHARAHRYVELDEELPYTLMDQKEAGKKVLYCVISLHVRGEGESAKESGGGKKSAGSRRGPYSRAFTRLSGRLHLSLQRLSARRLRTSQSVSQSSLSARRLRTSQSSLEQHRPSGQLAYRHRL